MRLLPNPADLQRLFAPNFLSLINITLVQNQKGGSKLSNLKIVIQSERGKCGEVVERVLE